MVVIQEHKTYFVSSRLHLLMVFGKWNLQLPSTTYVNIMGLRGNGRTQHIINSYISKTACCLFFTEETEGVNLSVS
jgi:hypothetical protein